MICKKTTSLMVLFLSLVPAVLCPMRQWIDKETIVALRASVGVQAHADAADDGDADAGTIELFQQRGNGDEGVWYDANAVVHVTTRAIFDDWHRRSRIAQRFCLDFFRVLAVVSDYYTGGGAYRFFSPNLPQRTTQCLMVLFDQSACGAFRHLEVWANDGLISREDAIKFHGDMAHFLIAVMSNQPAGMLLACDIEANNFENLIPRSLYDVLFVRRDKGREECGCGGCVAGATCTAACFYWGPGFLKCLLAALL